MLRAPPRIQRGDPLVSALCLRLLRRKLVGELVRLHVLLDGIHSVAASSLPVPSALDLALNGGVPAELVDVNSAIDSPLLLCALLTKFIAGLDEGDPA